jgi:hypothetical protein
MSVNKTEGSACLNVQVSLFILFQLLIMNALLELPHYSFTAEECFLQGNADCVISTSSRIQHSEFSSLCMIFTCDYF